jgi:hypothetical protein
MKLGRNDPCHCGSGQKYKKRCSKADEAARSAELAAQVVTAPEEEADEAAGPGATPGASNKGAPKTAAGPKPKKPPRQKTTQLRRRSM